VQLSTGRKTSWERKKKGERWSACEGKRLFPPEGKVSAFLVGFFAEAEGRRCVPEGKKTELVDEKE